MDLIVFAILVFIGVVMSAISLGGKGYRVIGVVVGLFLVMLGCFAMLDGLEYSYGNTSVQSVDAHGATVTNTTNTYTNMNNINGNFVTLIAVVIAAIGVLIFLAAII